jgi:hypothetical protein
MMLISSLFSTWFFLPSIEYEEKGEIIYIREELKEKEEIIYIKE